MTEHITFLEDLGAELSRVAAEAERASGAASPLRAGARTLATALGVAVLLGGTAYAVPVTRAVVDDITAPLAAWVSGDEDSVPGRAVAPSDEAPSWLTESGTDGARLIAEADGVGLYVHKVDYGRGMMLGFSLGQGRGITDTIDGWRTRLDRHAVYVLGDAIFGGRRGVLDDQGRIPLFGLTTRAVDRVELRYAEGPPLVSGIGDGGFVLLVDAWRSLREVVAYDASGRELGRADVSNYDLRYQCEKEPGCPASG